MNTKVNEKVTAIYGRDAGNELHDMRLEFCKKKARFLGKNNVVIYDEKERISGMTFDRPKLQELISDIKASKIETIIVYDLARITRSLAQFAEFMSILSDYGVTLVSVRDALDSGTAMSECAIRLLCLFAEYERENTVNRVAKTYPHCQGEF